MESIVFTLTALVIGLVAGLVITRLTSSGQISKQRKNSARIMEDAEKLADTIKKEAKLSAKEMILQAQTDFDKKIDERKNELVQLEKRLLNRERVMDKKNEQFEHKESRLVKKEYRLEDLERAMVEKNEEAAELVDKQNSRLQEIASLTEEQAREELKAKLLEQTRMDSAHIIKRAEEEAVSQANEKARFIIAGAIQRCASDYVAENTVSVVDLPNEEMKGRIIGREGRNIRALETATGVDLIIDDTPNAVILSSFDIVKREIASQTLQRLISDGRIHPGRIEDTVEKVSKEINGQMKKEGEKACFELGLDRVHPELIKLLGRLKYRTSYSQNVLGHSIEVGYLCGMMAAELNQDVKLAKRAGLLHDIGKAIDQNMEGSHTQIGGDLARKYNEPPVVINSICSHHEDEPAESVIALLVAASDALSASRPGARREMLQTYINRMQKLEEIGDSFKGVEKTYAIQAGREIRVVVEPEKIHDNEAFFLAKDIARKIESELAYPGEIKVTVIRETRVTESAR
ncbi:MAG TPA: ribonuclease Y [Nitrospirae bacterium]|nr:ribonuclease Y [Nitrospirota bacterium]